MDVRKADVLSVMVYASTESGNGDVWIVVLLLENPKKCAHIIKERVVALNV